MEAKARFIATTRCSLVALLRYIAHGLNASHDLERFGHVGSGCNRAINFGGALAA